jgi:hypothetical protein
MLDRPGPQLFPQVIPMSARPALAAAGAATPKISLPHPYAQDDKVISHFESCREGKPMSTVWREGEGHRWLPAAVREGLPLAGQDLQAPGIQVFRFGQGPDKGVALLAWPGTKVLVNGHPLLGGFHVLEHKDEFLVGRRRFYFSSESTPAAVVFRAEPGARPCTCPVCRGVIRDGDQAVQCPNCSRWFHQLEPAEGRPGRRCWTFAAQCRICNHPTSLSGEPVWRPEKEEAHA